MKLKGIIVFIFILFIGVCSGYSQFTYNPIDTTYKFNFKELSLIRDSIHTLQVYKLKSQNHEKQLEKFMDLVETQDEKIKKLELRDSFFVREVELYKQMDKIQNEKLTTSSGIIGSYQNLLSVKDQDIQQKNKEIKNERNWKNVYKFGYPVIGVLVGLLIITN